jgi:hypothetical protein
MSSKIVYAETKLKFKKIAYPFKTKEWFFIGAYKGNRWVGNVIDFIEGEETLLSSKKSDGMILKSEEIADIITEVLKRSHG